MYSLNTAALDNYLNQEERQRIREEEVIRIANESADHEMKKFNGDELEYLGELFEPSDTGCASRLQMVGPCIQDFCRSEGDRDQIAIQGWGRLMAFLRQTKFEDAYRMADANTPEV